MQYTGYVADIDDGIDGFALDFDETDYFDVETALVAQDRIRIEWMQGEELWALTITKIYGNENGTFGTGLFECSYTTRERGRYQAKRESGKMTATFYLENTELPPHKNKLFWIDVRWKMAGDLGRMMFELVRPAQ